MARDIANAHEGDKNVSFTIENKRGQDAFGAYFLGKIAMILTSVRHLLQCRPFIGAWRSLV